MAVAAGFEPAEGCPSRAFEARSFGRSDTPPRRTIPNPDASDEIRSGQAATSAAAGSPPEEPAQGRAALGLEDPAADVDPVVQAGVADDVEQ